MFFKVLLIGIMGTTMVTSSFADTHPHDFKQLLAHWANLEKSDEAGDFLDLQVLTIDDDKTFFQEQIGKEMAERPLSQVSKFSYEFLNHGVRADILSKLFPNSSYTPQFCEAISQVAKLKSETSNLDSGEIKKLEHKAYGICKKQVSQILSGIFYANPDTYLFLNQSKESKAGSLTVYIASLIEPNAYLRYKFNF